MTNTEPQAPSWWPLFESHLKNIELQIQSVHDRLSSTVDKQVFAAEQQATRDKFLELAKDIADMQATQLRYEERQTAQSRWIVSAFLAPFLVALIIYLFTRSTPIV